MPTQVDALVGASEPEDSSRGPHFWLNWAAQRAGQPRGAGTHGEPVLVHPVWQEWSLYSDAQVTGEVEFGPYEVLMTLSGGGQVGRPRQQLVLRQHDHLFEGPLDAGG